MPPQSALAKIPDTGFPTVCWLPGNWTRNWAKKCVDKEMDVSFTYFVMDSYLSLK
jgi:hypothetical protein